MAAPTPRTPSVSTGTGTNVGGTPGNYVSNIVVTRPTGTTDNDLIHIAILTDGSATGLVQTLAGWSPNPNNPLTLTSDGSRGYVFSKVASGEPATWTFLSDLNNGNDYTAIAVAVSGQGASWNTDSSHPTVNNTGSFSPLTMTESGVTTTIDDSLLLYFGFGDPSSSNTGSWADPGGWTSGANSYSNYCPLLLATKTQAVAGASGSAAATLTFLTGTCSYGAIIIPIAPSVGGGGGSVDPSVRTFPHRTRPYRSIDGRWRMARLNPEFMGNPPAPAWLFDESVRPNALSLTNLSGAYADIDDDPSSPDAAWLTVK